MSSNPFNILNSLSPTTQASSGQKAVHQPDQETLQSPGVEQTLLRARPQHVKKSEDTKFKSPPQISNGQNNRPADVLVTSTAAPDITDSANWPTLRPATPVLPTPKAPILTFPGGNKSLKSAPSKGPKAAQPQSKVIKHLTTIEIWAQEDNNTPEEVDKCYPLNRLIARSKYFATKYANEPLTYTGTQPFLRETLHTNPVALMCVLGMLKSWPLELPAGSKSRPQVIFDGGRCHHSDMPRGIDFLHYADLYQVTQILSLSGAYEEQFSVQGALIKYCQADRPDERLAAVLNRCWIDRLFSRRLLNEIVGTLENLDGATDDTRFAGPRQTSFSAYAASQSASLSLNYIDVRNKWLEKLNNKKRREAQKTGNHQQTGQQSAQQSGSKGQQPSKKKDLKKKGSQQSFQQSSSKIGSMTPEDSEKYYGKRGMGGS